MTGQAQRPDRPGKDQADVGVPQNREWPYNPRYSRPDITEGEARAESYYAMQMYSAASAGKLDQFMDQQKARIAS